MFRQWDEHMSYRQHRVPPLQRTQRRGTHSRVIGEETKTEGRASAKGVSILLCKRPGFVFGDGVPGKGAVPLPWPSDLEATPVSLRNSLQGRHAFRP